MASPYALDWTPISEAIDSNRQFGLAKNKLAMEQERLGWERDFQPLRLKAQQLQVTQAEKMNPLELRGKEMELNTAALGHESALAKRFGGLAQIGEAEPDDEKRKDMLGKVYASDPRIRTEAAKFLPPELLDDPTTVFRYWKALAKGYVSDEDKAAKEAATAKTRADTYEAVAKGDKAYRGEPLDEAIAGVVRRTMGGGAPAEAAPPRPGRPDIPRPGGPAPGTPGVRPMGGPVPDVPAGDPALIRVAEPGAAGAPVGDGKIVTPYGRLTPDDARSLGGALLLSPGRAEAGKALLESVEREAGKLGKEAGNENDKAELKATTSLANLRNISASLDDKYLKVWPRLGLEASAFGEKWLGKKMTPEQQASVYSYSTFRQDASRNINQAIKDNSGATVTDQELQRNMVEHPNAGSGLFDGDPPTVFKAKMDRAMEVLALGVARQRFLRSKGFAGKPWEAMELDDMRRVINDRARNIEAEVKAKAPGLDPVTLGREVDMRVRKEFGI